MSYNFKIQLSVPTYLFESFLRQSHTGLLCSPQPPSQAKLLSWQITDTGGILVTKPKWGEDSSGVCRLHTPAAPSTAWSDSSQAINKGQA